MVVRLPPTCRSVQDDLSDTYKNIIGAIFTAVMTGAMVCALWDSLTTAIACPEPKDNGWKASEVQQ